MAIKLIAFATVVAAASAGILQPAPLAYHSAHQAAPLTYSHAVPLAYAQKSYEPEYPDSNPEYSYSYNVHDTLTGDAKSQQETRHGDAVEGSYSLIEADGTRRVVHYTADDHNGFNAVVEKQPANIAVQAPVHVKTVAPVPVAYQHATPVVKVAAPVYAPHGYAAPALHQSYYH